MSDRRWVLDTNVLISRLLAPSGTAAKAVDHALASGVLLVSEATMTELSEVLARPKLDPYISVQDRQNFLRLLGGVSRMVNITHRVQACRDPEDDKFLHVMLNGEAETLVTGDSELLALHRFHGIPIVRPADFIQMDWR